MATISKKTQDRTKAQSARTELKLRVPKQMAFWPDHRRAIANELARSSLFSCRDVRAPRRQFQNAKLFMLGDGVITYTGEELRGRDEDLFLTLAHLARATDAGNLVVKVTNAQLCKLIGWRQDQRFYNEIFKSVQRLKGAVVTLMSRRLTKVLACEEALAAGASEEVLARLYDDLQAFDNGDATTPKVGVSGIMLSMLDGEATFTGEGELIDEIPQGNLNWTIRLDRRMVALFAKPYLTLVDLDTRKALSHTARRLQAYYLSHKEAHDVLLASLAQMLDINMPAHKLKPLIENCLIALREHGVIADYEFYDNSIGECKVRVRRANRTDNEPTDA